MDDLVSAIYAYIQPIYFPTSGGGAVPKFTEIELKSIVGHSINGYLNSFVKDASFSSPYNSRQQFFIDSLLEGIFSVPVRSIADFILQVEDNINKSDLSYAEQVPLFLATIVGKNDFDYWIAKANAPGQKIFLCLFNTSIIAFFLSLQGIIAGKHRFCKRTEKDKY